MPTHFMRVAWIASVMLVAAGAILVVLFPQPFITYYCASGVCPTEVSGRFSGGYLVIVMGLVVAVVATIMSVVTKANHRRNHHS